jgi:hypothetical protein
MNKFEEDFKTLLDAMVDGFTQEAVEKNKESVIKIQQAYESNPNRFFDALESAQLHFNTIVSQVVNIPKQKNAYIIGHIISGLYEHFINKLMCMREGSGCSTDKSKFITRSTLKALRENQNLSLFNDYSQCEQIKEDKEKQAYWSPKTIKDTDEAMKLFWDWYLLKIDL